MEPQKIGKLKNISIPASATIRDAFAKMDQDIVRLLCVLEDDQYVGIVSAGDIQRAIIANYSLETQIVSVFRSEVRVAKAGDSFDEIRELMLKHRTEFMPVLDENGVLVDIHFWDDVFSTTEPEVGQVNLPVIIMAGGKGTRLKPISNILPKPLFPLSEKTILEEIMDRFKRCGSDEFHLSVNYRKEMITTYFDQLGDRYDISYFTEDKPLGTAGSLSLLKDEIDSTFFVSNCDIIIEADYEEIVRYHREAKNEITMVVALKEINIPYGTVDTVEDGQIAKLVEKPTLNYKINTGFYVLEPGVLDAIPENEFFHITSLIEKIKDRGGRVGAFPIGENAWRDIGEWDEYRRAIKLLG